MGLSNQELHELLAEADGMMQDIQEKMDEAETPTELHIFAGFYAAVLMHKLTYNATLDARSKS